MDETYERILLEIDEEKQVYANRLFQCLAMSIRPLRVEELAEIFAVLPNAESTPEFDISWRPDDPEEFIISACSTLVTMVNTRDGTIVQFSHFSVKEYLTSDRIAHSAPISHFRVLPKQAHTLLARACLGVLLQLDYSIDKTIKNFPLARYAAQHWVDHARFEDVSSYIRDGMCRLFNKDKPHLGAWLWVYHRDQQLCKYFDETSHPKQPDAVPLYYAAAIGLRGLVEYLLDEHPQYLDAEGGGCGTPLNAALYNGHQDIALFLLERGAYMEKRGMMDQTGLYLASFHGYTEVVRILIDRGADLNAECDEQDESEWGSTEDLWWTPLHVALSRGRLEVARVLLEYGADVNRPDSLGRSPLRIALFYEDEFEDLVQLLMDHGANPSASDAKNETPLHGASFDGEPRAVGLLLHHGSDVNAWSGRRWNLWDSKWELVDGKGWTPLHYAAFCGHIDIAEVLLDHGADVNTPDQDHWTPLHLAAWEGFPELVDTLPRCGANLHARTTGGQTPFEFIKNWHFSKSSLHYPQIMQPFSDHTGESGYYREPKGWKGDDEEW